MDRRERDLRKLAKKYGLTVEHGKKHFKLIDKNGVVVSIAPVSGSDHRGVKNQEAHLRRWKNSH